jgi:hypothetical protein
VIAQILISALPILCDGDIVEAIEAAQGQPIEIHAPDLQSTRCTLKRPVVIAKPTTITGPGEWFLSIDAPTGAFHARAWLKLRGLNLWRADWPTERPAIGVFAEARVVVEEVELSGFTVGVYVHASVAEYGTNANASIIRDVKIAGSGHAGIILRGRDANVFMLEAVRVYTSCEHASLWIDSFGPCAGIVERSFFGGVIDAPLISSTGEVIGGVRSPGVPLAVLGSSSHTVIDGLYRERDQLNPQLGPSTVAIGGLSTQWDGDGLRIDGPAISGFEVRNAKDPSNVVTLRAGNRAASGTWLEYVPPWDPSRPLRVKAERASKCYRYDLANQLVTSRTCQDGIVFFPRLSNQPF